MVSDPHPCVERPHHDGNQVESSPSSVSVHRASKLDDVTGAQDWQASRIREWLLLLLRFAITRDPKDEAAALDIAEEIDALGLRWRPSAPSFFRRTSDEVCKAIAAPNDPTRAIVLKKHIARIDEPRLRRAFHAAVDLGQGSAADCKVKRPDLWTGLPK